MMCSPNKIKILLAYFFASSETIVFS